MSSDLRSTVRALTRAVHRRRALLSAGLVAAAVATALPQLAPPVPPGRSVLAAARDLPAGTVLSAGDLVRVALPATLAPAGVLDAPAAAVGRLLAGPVRRGEPLTDVRLLGAGLLTGLDDAVATPVRLADPAGAALLSAGDVVDVLAAAADGTAAAAPVVAAGVTVLAVPTAVEPADGALVVLATTPATAARLAAAAVSSRLSVTVRAR